MEKRPACEHEDVNIFFPDPFYTPEDTALAKEICSTCPVFDWCKKNFAGEKYGVFYGTTPKERGHRVKIWFDDDED